MNKGICVFVTWRRIPKKTTFDFLTSKGIIYEAKRSNCMTKWIIVILGTQIPAEANVPNFNMAQLSGLKHVIFSTLFE